MHQENPARQILLPLMVTYPGQLTFLLFFYLYEYDADDFFSLARMMATEAQSSTDMGKIDTVIGIPHLFDDMTDD